MREREAGASLASEGEAAEDLVAASDGPARRRGFSFVGRSMPRGNGHSNFEALRTRAAARATYVVFDLLLLDGRDLCRRPLEERRALLADLVADAEGILFSESIFAEGDVVFDAACRMGLEGIVSKRLGSPYQSGRTRFWLKIKNPQFIRASGN